MSAWSALGSALTAADPRDRGVRAALRADDVVARVGEVEITAADFETEMARRGGERPGSYATPESRRALLDELIRFEVQVQSARAAGYEHDPEVRAGVDRMMVARFREDRLDAGMAELSVTPQEVEDLYEAQREMYAVPERRRGALVFVEISPMVSEERAAELEDRAHQALEEARNLPADVAHFGDVARRYSDDRASRFAGGTMGWLSEEQRATAKWESVVVDALFNLDEPGEIAPAVHTGEGIYLVRLAALEKRATRPLEALRAGIEAQLLRRQQEALRDRYFEELWQQSEVVIHQKLLAEIAPPAEASPPPLPGADG